MQVIPQSTFRIVGDFEVYPDGSVRNLVRDSGRTFGTLSGPYRVVSCHGKSFYVHRLVAEAFCEKPNEYFGVVDHLDPGKSNDYRYLRYSTPRLNAINNTQLGVDFHCGKWRATCCKKHLGHFTNSRDAILAVQRAKRTEYGVEFERVAGYPPRDVRMSFEFAPFYISPGLLSRARNGLKESHENVELGPFAR